MALDKQRILNELGSVMNQLQSADCGCMDKLFSSPVQSSPTDGHSYANHGGLSHGCSYNHGCGHYGSHNSLCAGEPHTTMNGNPMSMGRCNPPKLYADTYNYLNQNLMQPVVKDVYNDLKNLTPVNAVANNPMASQMGLPAQVKSNPVAEGIYCAGQSNTASPMTSGMMGNQMQNICNRPGLEGNQMIGNITGMGSQIVNMMTGDGKSKPSNLVKQGGPLTGPMVIDAPNSPYGQVGVTPLNPLTGYNQGQLNQPMEASYASQEFPNLQPQNLTSQNTHGDTRFNHSQINHMTHNDANTHRMGNINTNPAAQQLTTNRRNPHGMHAPGVAKFNEMFPGVTQDLGGDLGFDPMAIAIQMNPANQQKVAMDTMQKIMNGTSLNRDLNSGTISAMQPVINGAQVATASFAQPLSSQAENISPINQQIIQNKKTTSPSNEIVSDQNQQVNTNLASNQLQAQQLHTAVTGNPSLNPQDYHHHPHHLHHPQLPQHDQASYQTRQINDPRHATTVLHTPESDPQNSRFHSNPANLPPQTIIKDPIFPVDSSKNTVSPSLMKTKYFDYNTLGQPMEMLPSKMYHTQELYVPQTLSPQPPLTRKRQDYMKYSTVKSTVSKTSLMANKPIGKVPSRGQLQNIYNQYKGSQSFTQQNITPPTQGVTHSEGHIATNEGYSKSQRRLPVERVGDVVVNNTPPNATSENVEQVIGHIGDGPMEKSLNQDALEKAPIPNSKLRNGLQDMVYTSYPTSAAWSFHGNNRAPYYPGRRSRY